MFIDEQIPADLTQHIQWLQKVGTRKDWQLCIAVRRTGKLWSTPGCVGRSLLTFIKLLFTFQYCPFQLLVYSFPYGSVFPIFPRTPSRVRHYHRHSVTGVRLRLCEPPLPLTWQRSNFVDGVLMPLQLYRHLWTARIWVACTTRQSVTVVRLYSCFCSDYHAWKWRRYHGARSPMSPLAPTRSEE